MRLIKALDYTHKIALKWWDENGKLLLWGVEKAQRLAAQLRAAGIELEI